MKIIRGSEAVEFEPTIDGDFYEFPCGCRFRIRKDLPPVNGHYPMVLDRDMRLDCSLVYEMLAEGVTIGVFQLESRLGKTYSVKQRPEEIEHLAALGALLRPGVLKSKTDDGVSMTDLYCMRKNGLAENKVDIEAISDLLEPTYNVLCYQEQLMRIAAKLAAFNSMEVDSLRSAVGKKKMDKLAEIGKLFIDRCEEVGFIDRAKAEALFENIKKSGKYLFNKCLDGNELIRRPSKGRYPFTPTIAEMYQIRNDREYAKSTGHAQLHKKWRLSGDYGMGLSIDSDGRVRRNIVEDIQPAGVQTLYEVKLVDGKKTRVTANHKFPTRWGDLTVDQLLGLYDTQKTWVGLKLLTCGPYEQTTKTYAFSNETVESRYAKHHDRKEAGIPGESNYAFTNGGYTKFQLFRATTPDVCKRCSDSESRIETHHIDGDRTNNEWDNLEKLCVSCHKKVEYAMGRTRRGQKGYPVVPVQIESIAPVGEGMTYDVTMGAPNHTFTTGEGIVTCNSHAVTYAYGSYETAYFKAHFPVYFFTSYLDGAKHKMKPLREVRNLIRDARRFGIKVLTPRFVDLNPIFGSDNIEIRFGLANVKGVGEKAVAKMAGALDKEAMLTWKWFDFLTLGSAVCGAMAVRNLIQAGAMTEWELPRQRMLAEYEAWSSLSPKEQEGVLGLKEPLHKTVDVMETREIEVEVPEYDRSAVKAYKALLKSWEEQGVGGDPPIHPEPIGTKLKKKKERYKFDEVRELVDAARPVANLEEALRNLLDRPGGVAKNRRAKVESILSLLLNPPFPLKDTPYLIAKNEEELLGVPVTTNAMEHVDRSILNTTIREFNQGKNSHNLMIIGAEVAEFFEREVRNGDNRGAKMASLVLTDGELSMDDVVVFPEAWDRYGLVLKRPGTVVAVGGKRNYKNPQGFIVEKVWSL